MSRKVYHAHYIDEYQFGYKCDSCPLVHRHGNCLDYNNNRTEGRSSHCEKMKGEIMIVIDDSTVRKLNARAMKKYRKFLKSRNK